MAESSALRISEAGSLADVDRRLWTYLSKTKLSDLKDIYGGNDASS
jgi:hypothetical protein